jgi:hypothetical protein
MDIGKKAQKQPWAGRWGLFLAWAVVLGLSFVACKEGDDEESKGGVMSMKTKQQSVEIGLGGTGTVSIDWGDGKSETETLSDHFWGSKGFAAHDYSDTTVHTIRITGNIVYLNCADNALTSLDVSQNTALEVFICSKNILTSLDVSQNTALDGLHCNNNQLTSLNVSQNTALELLHCDNNQLENLDLSTNTKLFSVSLKNNGLTATALNTLFGTLHSGVFGWGKAIFIHGNPGTNDPGLQTELATSRGWEVDTAASP